MGVGRLEVYSGGRNGQLRGKDCLNGTTGGGAWVGGGLPCLSIIIYRRVDCPPQLRGWGMH